MLERRKTIRISDSFKVSYQVIKSFRMISSHSRDISEGGICIPILQHLQPKMILDLEIYLEGNKPIKATGEIVWVEEIKDLNSNFLCGIKFSKINPEAAERLRIYIKEKAEDERLKWLD